LSSTYDLRSASCQRVQRGFLRSAVDARRGAEALLARVPEEGGLRFVTFGQMRAILMFWEEEQDFDPETSSDLYFGDNAIYREGWQARDCVRD